MIESPSQEPVLLDGHTLTLAELEDVARNGRQVALSTEAHAAVRAARDVVERAIGEHRVVYGVNTGFGDFADVVIPDERLLELQANLIRSHSVGVGEILGVAETRGLMLLRANVLARGRSGIRPEPLLLLLELLNRRVHPLVPSQGSVGASGDLAPLAHLALALIGEGTCLGPRGPCPAEVALRDAGLAPVVLTAKEGLALINGTQLMTAVTALTLGEAQRLVRAADVLGALTVDVLRGTDVAFDPRIHAERPHAGQGTSAANLRKLMAGSGVRESHRDCGRVQDAYSLRCIPQVHGAVRDALAYVATTIAVEMNAATDNPMVFAETGEIISGGNFHGAPVALAADVLAIGAAQLASMSERRTERLVNPHFSALPAFLARQGGLQSGLMMAQVTAAALASENKVLAHPASVDSIPTSAGKEDHVSMGAHAALKAARVTVNTRRVLAVELLCACEALEFLRPLRTSAPLEAVHALVRTRAAALAGDRALGADIEALAELLRSGDVLRAAESVCGAIP